MNKKKFKQVCECTNCGNEAEMEITCRWVEEGGEAQEAGSNAPDTKKVKGTGVCTECGNEADMWVDI